DPALLGGIHILGKTGPIPGHALREHVKGNGLDVDQIPSRNLPRRGPARRQTYATVTHDETCHTMPGGAGKQWVPANLRIIVRVRIDKTWGDDEIGSVYDAFRAVRHFADRCDLPSSNCHVRPVGRSPGPIDYRPILNKYIV